MRKLIIALSFVCLLAFGAMMTFAARPQPVDLRVMPWQGPASPMVNSPYQYRVTVKNIGGTAAANVKVVVDLPLTNTSPVKYILGKVSGLDPQKCQILSNKINCSLNTLTPNQSKDFTFNFELPVSTRTLSFNAVASTTTAGDPQANNALSHTPSPAYGTRQIFGPVNVLISRCTGQNLSSYYECEVSPGSVTTVMFELNADQSISYSGYGTVGLWDQFASTRQLHMQLMGGSSVAEFNGFSTGGNCFEGLTTFGPNSPYVSPYKVCIQ